MIIQFIHDSKIYIIICFHLFIMNDNFLDEECNFIVTMYNQLLINTYSRLSTE